MPADKDVIYTAATHVKTTLENMGRDLAPSHAHELIAACMGFNSKKALIDSGAYDLHDQELGLTLQPDLPKLEEKMRKLRPDLFQIFTAPLLSRVIKTGLTPPCECCGYRLAAVVPITGRKRDIVDGWVCMHCVDRYGHAYGACHYCGEGIVYRAETLNSKDECPEHAGESNMDSQEEEDLESLAEYLHNH